MLSEPVPVSAAEAGSRMVVMTTSQPQLLATGGIVAATTAVGSTVPVLNMIALFATFCKNPLRASQDMCECVK